MGWGEPCTPHQQEVPVGFVQAAIKLGDAVRHWNVSRYVKDEEAVASALAQFDRCLERVDL